MLEADTASIYQSRSIMKRCFMILMKIIMKKKKKNHVTPQIKLCDVTRILVMCHANFESCAGWSITQCYKTYNSYDGTII